MFTWAHKEKARMCLLKHWGSLTTHATRDPVPIRITEEANYCSGPTEGATHDITSITSLGVCSVSARGIGNTGIQPVTCSTHAIQKNESSQKIQDQAQTHTREILLW